MTLRTDRLVQVHLNDKDRGWIDPARVGRHHPADVEPRPRVTEHDLQATRLNAARERRARGWRAAE
jgi:hypothetical protein